MNEEVRALMAEVLDEGLDDWVTLGQVLNRALNCSGNDAISARTMAVAVIKLLLVNDLAVAGNIGDSGFEAWDASPEQALDRILLECKNRNWVLGLTDVWLATTERGDDLARLMNVEGETVLDRFISDFDCRSFELWLSKDQGGSENKPAQ